MYRTRDSLKNFRIRVDLHKLTSSGLGGSLGDTGGRLTASRTSTATGQENEAWTFRWQEKMFSQHEEELYADQRNCTSALEEKYHRDILALRTEGGRPNCRLFSYVDTDQFFLPTEEMGQLLCEPESVQETYASKNASFVRRRPVGRIKETLPRSVIREPLQERPSEDDRLASRIPTPPSQSMHLMADLRKLDGRDDGDEQVLCSIRVDSHGVVTVSPDFNEHKPAYRIENRHREVFEYRLIHDSEPISHNDTAKEKKLHSELYTQHDGYLQACVGSGFTEPPDSDALRVMLFGEIVCAKGFEYNNLYINAHLELPEFWLQEGEGEDDHTLSVTTQICRTKSRHKYDIAFFNCPFDFQLVYSNPTLSAGALPKWPRVLLEVASLDHWERHRVEGYGYADLPSTAGSHELTVQTWRPTGRRVVDKMKRFFTGGPPEIDDISYVACPRDFQGTHLSRYGFRVESAGNVTLSLNIIHQSSLLIRNVPSDGLIKYKGFTATVAAALGEYQKAKERAAVVSATIH